MPLFVQPILRQLQRSMELNGLIQTRNSVGRDLLADKEATGFKEVTGIEFWVLRNTKYTAPVSGA